MKLIDVSLPLCVWAAHRVMVPHHRRYVKESVAILADRGSLCAGQGVFRMHITRSLMNNEALCGAYLSSMGGAMGRADCLSCIRIARRAGSWPVAP